MKLLKYQEFKPLKTTQSVNEAKSNIDISGWNIQQEVDLYKNVKKLITILLSKLNTSKTTQSDSKSSAKVHYNNDIWTFYNSEDTLTFFVNKDETKSIMFIDWDKNKTYSAVSYVDLNFKNKYSLRVSIDEDLEIKIEYCKKNNDHEIDEDGDEISKLYSKFINFDYRSRLDGPAFILFDVSNINNYTIKYYINGNIIQEKQISKTHDEKNEVDTLLELQDKLEEILNEYPMLYVGFEFEKDENEKIQDQLKMDVGFKEKKNKILTKYSEYLKFLTHIDSISKTNGFTIQLSGENTFLFKKNDSSKEMTNSPVEFFS